MFKLIRIALKKLIALGCILLVIATSWLFYYANMPFSIDTLPLDFRIKPGSTLRSSAKQMVDARVLKDSWQFIILARVLGKSDEIKAGNYQLQIASTPLQLLKKITKGDATQTEIKFIEGWTFSEMKEVLRNNPSVRKTILHLTETEILKLIGAPEPALEGIFFPDTYYFSVGTTDLIILKRAYATMQKHIQSAWQTRAPRLPYNTLYEALIMASIVEKETGKASDRSLVAAVFTNRLRKKMRLQTDPTVIYGMGETFDGNLRKKDLLTDHPFNTYTRAGLPPTPIAMPGLASIQSVMHPAEANVLYFVAKGDGSSYFSSSLVEHNRAVDKYQKRRN